MSDERLLVVGAGGFIGRHFLAGSAFATGMDVVTLGRRAAEKQRHHAVDCGDLDALRHIVREESPSHIVSFAGSASGGFATLLRYNVEVAEALLDSARASGTRTRVLLMGSAAEYGAPEGCPLDESSPRRPVSSYGVTKKMQSDLAAFYRRIAGENVEVVVARLFNALGAGLPESLVFGSFVRQIAAMDASGALRAGNLESRRDFIHVSDAVRALDALLALRNPEPEYVIASGRDWSVRELLDRLIEASGKSVEVEVDPGRIRSNDVSAIYGSYAAMERDTGWQPERSPEEALREMLDEAEGR